MTTSNGAAPGQESGPAKTPSSPQATESAPKLPDRGTMLDAANAVLTRGWKPVQVHHVLADSGCSCGSSTCRAVGKHPVETGWQQLPMSGADIWSIWNPDDGIDPQANVGVQTGWASGGLLVVDIDRPSALDEVVVRVGPEITDTNTVQNGSGGQHRGVLEQLVGALDGGTAGGEDLAVLATRVDTADQLAHRVAEGHVLGQLEVQVLPAGAGPDGVGVGDLGAEPVDELVERRESVDVNHEQPTRRPPGLNADIGL